MNHVRSHAKGFTLTEVIVVSVIVGILAAISIPMYQGYVKSARIDSGKSTCELIGSGVVFTHNRGLNIGATSWSDIGMTDPSDASWAFTFPAILGAATLDATYKITATGLKGQGIGYFYPKAGGTARYGGVFTE